MRRRLADLGFALAATASLAAGFMLGVLAIDGNGTGAAVARTATVATNGDTDWISASERTLSDVYFFDTSGGTELSQ